MNVYNEIVEQIERKFIFNGHVTILGNCISSLLVKPSATKSIMNNCERENECGSIGIDIFGGDGNYVYSNSYNKNLSPLVYRRNNNSIELIEEFRLLYNLYERKDNDKIFYYKKRDNERYIDIVCIRKKNDSIVVDINYNYLKEFLALKKRHLAIYFNTEFPLDDETGNINPFLNKKKDCIYEYYKKDGYGLIDGKCILRYNKSDIKELWGEVYEKFVEFVGTEIKSNDRKMLSCDRFILMDKLEPIIVFFNKNVLIKYYSLKDCTISDGMIYTKYWSLPIDNDSNDDIIAVELSELSYLPYEEQSYWKQYNVEPCFYELSDTAIKRWYNGENVKPSVALDLVFKNKYIELNKKWEKQFGWKLFLELAPSDKTTLTNLHLITENENIESFGTQILYLSKILIDSLNESKITSEIVSKENLEKKKGSINKFELWSSEKNKKMSKSIETLRKIQKCRSGNVAHRKSREKTAEDYGKGYLKIIFKEAIESLDELNSVFLCNNE